MAAASAPRRTGTKRKVTKKVHTLSGVGSVGLKVKGALDEAMFEDFIMKLLKTRARHSQASARSQVPRDSGARWINGVF